MKPLSLLHLSLLSAVSAATLAPSIAHAELSDRSKGIVWNVEHFVYLDKCRFDKPMPPSPDSYYVGECERSYEQEQKNLAVLTDAEKKDPRAVAVFDMHKKSAAHIAKAKAAYEAATTSANNAAAEYEAFKKDAKQNADGLWVLYQLDKHQENYTNMYVSQGSIEEKLKKAQSVKAFADKCVSSYGKITPKYKPSEYLDDPALTCSMATRRDDILKNEMPKLFPKMRAMAVSESKAAMTKIADSAGVWDSTIACAQAPSKCGSREEQIARVAKALGVSAGSPTAPDEAAFKAAMAKATSKRRIGKLHDGAREGVAAKAVKEAGIAYIATAVFEPADFIKKNEWGLPVYRVRDVGFLVKTNNEPFCRAYTVSVSADYEGGGRYGTFTADSFSVDKDQFVVSACK